jgi:RHS repeat-associated protein
MTHYTSDSGSQRHGGTQGPSFAYSYTYDPAGNRLYSSGPSLGTAQQLSYNALNQIIGSSTTLSNVAYQWDAENRLTAIIRGTNTSQLRYDGFGRRLRITELTNDVVQSDTYYLWCGTEICEVRDSTGGTVLRRLFPQGESLVGMAGNTNYYYTKDNLGSIVEALDTNGNVVAQYSYSPYGQRYPTENGFQSTFGFTGDFVHQQSGLYLTWFRSLDSSSGRWLCRDPLGEMLGGNLYSYVGNNPINTIDPYGLCDSSLPLTLAGAPEGVTVAGAVLVGLDLSNPVGWVILGVGAAWWVGDYFDLWNQTESWLQSTGAINNWRNVNDPCRGVPPQYRRYCQ